MLVRISQDSNIDDTKVRMRCRCGAEWSPMQSRACPACGEKIPAAMATDGVTWKPMESHRMDTLRGLLQPNALNEVPEEHREKLRESIRAELSALESGGAIP